MGKSRRLGKNKKISKSMMDPELIRGAQEEKKMSNPESLKMASEGMKILRPEDEQLKHPRPKEMANASPEELAAMRVRLDAHVTYKINDAEMLKKQGNELHSQGRYNDALQKYLLAKNNLIGIPPSKSRTLLCECSLNLMSCYLKTGQYDNCIMEGTEVLAHDAKNIKALYRRGQAYKALGQFGSAVLDLTTAHEISPKNETIANVLRDAKENLMKLGGGQKSKANHQRSPTESFVSKPQESSGHSPNQPDILGASPSTSSEHLQPIKDDLEFIRFFQNLTSHIDPKTLAAMGDGQAEDMSPDMIRIAMNIISKMPPEEFQKMIELDSSSQGDNPFLTRGSFNSKGVRSTSQLLSGTTSQSSIPSSSADLQEQMRDQIKDPAMQQMLLSLIKDINPDMMANTSEQFGLEFSREDAVEAQQAMSSFSLEDLDRMMRWADRLLRVVEGAKKTKNWFLGRPGMILAIVMLPLAIFLHWLG